MRSLSEIDRLISVESQVLASVRAKLCPVPPISLIELQLMVRIFGYERYGSYVMAYYSQLQLSMTII